MERAVITSHCLASAWSGRDAADDVIKRLLLTTLVLSLWTIQLGHGVTSTVENTVTGTALLREPKPTPDLHSAADTVTFNLLSGSAEDLSLVLSVTSSVSLTDDISGTVQAAAGINKTATSLTLAASPLQTASTGSLKSASTEVDLKTSFQSTAVQAELSSREVVRLTDSLSFPVLATTDFVDSVAASIRRDPQENWVESSSTLVSIQPTKTATQGSGELSEVTTTVGNTAVGETVIEIVSSPDSLGITAVSANISITPLLQASSDGVVSSDDSLTVTDSLAVFHTVESLRSATSSLTTDMVVTNSTIHPGFTDTHFVTASSPSGEATIDSVTSSAPEVTSPSAVSGNDSCAHDGTGCVEYRSDDAGDDTQMKVIVGVVCGVVAAVIILVVVIGCLCRRRGKMPSGSKIDLSSYWDDSVTLSYINGHVDIPKDSADEMISLDNDSFLNSLDSMSFSNTWTSDNSKHTIF